MTVYAYVTLPTGTVHLSHDESDRTLCGLVIPTDQTIEDETTSGVAATCKNCRRSLNKRWPALRLC